MKDWRTISAFISVCLMLGGLVWAAARYPTRDEFNTVKARVRSHEDKIYEDVLKIRENQARIKTDIEHIKSSQNRIERLLDSAFQ